METLILAIKIDRAAFGPHVISVHLSYSNQCSSQAVLNNVKDDGIFAQWIKALCVYVNIEEN